MFKPRALVLLCALVLVANGPLLGQEGRPASRRPVQIDPEQDEVLLTIKAAVQPSPEQTQKILELYRSLRQEQRRAMREAMQSVRGDRDPQRPPDREAFRAARREAMTLAAEKIEAINIRFLADCRGLLEPEQLEAWDGCAAGLDLAPRRGRRGRGMLDPARGPKVGEAAPAFELTDLEGRAVSLESLRGKPAVIEFGSYTCPVFRRQVEAIDELRRDFGDTVHWVLVYTKEAHPTDGWAIGINAGEGIELPQHTSFEKRLQCARLCTEKLGLDLLVLVDGFEDKVTEAYSGHPNRGYVIDATGTIVSKQGRIDAPKTRKALEQLLGEPRT